MTDLNVAAIKICTEVEGPFKRMAIWFQGCDVGCPGCCNPKFIPFEKKHIISVDEITKIAIQSRSDNNIEGITFLGGEPTIQKGIIELAESLKRNDFGIILFTGHAIETIDKNLVKNVDMIVDGPFKKELIDNNRNMIGSTNQNIVNISKRYENEIKWFTDRRNKKIEYEYSDSILVSNGDIIE